MKLSFPLIFIILSIFISCNQSGKKQKVAAISNKKNPVKEDTSSNYQAKILASIPKNIRPVMGYRFVIVGDFNGDGKKDTLTEHYISAIDNKETNKFYDGLANYDQQVALTISKNPVSFVTSNSKNIDTLHISSNSQLFGLSFLKNEGDLNGDGTDEVAYVIDWADWSNSNTCHLVTYKKGKWVELYSFPIWDWQIPGLPDFQNNYGLFGTTGLNSSTGNDTLNQRLEKQVKDFRGFIKLIKPGKIKVWYEDMGEQRTKIVNLKRINSNL